ncbi:MAG: NFACT family protein [Clostridiales bacterium]|nr:NFACT family protein [Clostridiales bacterium]
MSLDGIFLYHLKNEIADFALGARVEKIHQPSAQELVLTLRSPQGARRLLLSCRADSARAQFTDFRFENPKEAPMLCMLLRKKLCTAKICEVTQDSLERIIKIDFLARNSLGDNVTLRLVCEFMGRYSNIILLNENGVIIDALKRVGKEKSQVRTILPGEKYTPPPGQNKLNILCEKADVIEAKIKETGKTPAKAFQEVVMGVSPIVAREYENGVSAEKIKHYAENPQKVAVITDKPIDFTFLPVTQYGGAAKLKYFGSFSELLDFYYFEKLKKQKIDQRAGDLLKRLGTLSEHTVRKIINRENELKQCEGKEKYKLYGDLLSTNMYRLKSGAGFYDIENYYDGMKPVRIPVSPALSVSQNIQKYYKEYRKKQVAEKKLSTLIKEAKAELEYLESAEVMLEKAEANEEISLIKAELADAGYIKLAKKERAKAPKAAPVQYISSDGFKILVGKSNVMNDRLSLKIAKGGDLWLHAKDCPGSHVIIINSGSEFTQQAIYEAALLAAANSKAGASSNVAVDFTEARHVKKPAGAKPGAVIYTDYKTLFVTPDSEEIERIKKIV